MGKNIGILLVVVVLVGAGWWYYSNQQNQTTQNENNSELSQDNTTELSNDAQYAADDSDSMVDLEVVVDDDMTGEVKEFRVVGTNFAFSEKEITVNKGDTVRIVFVNEEGFHDWVLDEFDAATSQIQAGNQETIEFVADQSGEFEYYCSVGQHRAMGMVGKLIVE